MNLYRSGVYHYNPTMHHGPFLYYLGLIPFFVLGINTFSLRFLPALCNSTLLLLLIPLRKHIGEKGVVAAGIMLALSPINVFYSREIIHESYFIFFSLAAVVFATCYLENRKTRYIAGIAMSLGFLWTIKETVVITVFVWMAALVGTFVIDSMFEGSGRRKKKVRNLLTKMGIETWRLKFILVSCFFLVFAIGIVLYSSFFTHWQGVADFFSGVKAWISQGVSGQGHQKPFFYYLELLVRFELPIILLGVIGILYGFRKRSSCAIFVSLWAIFLFIIYSFIPYKTPWLLMNIVLPLSLLAGFSMNEILAVLIGRKGLLIFAIDVAIVAVCLLGYHAVKVSFFDYENDRHPLTYVQTKRDIKKLVSRIEQVSATWPEGKNTEIKILSPHYWPLPWYLRDYYRVGYFGEVVDEADAPLIIGSLSNKDELENKLKDDYHTDSYELRQGVELILYIRSDVWDRCCVHHDSVDSQ